MATNVMNLVMGPADLYLAPFSTEEPADAAVNSAPSATAGWVDLGGTMGGTELTFNLEYKTLEVDQVVDVVGRRLTSRDMSVKTQLAETTLRNLAVVLNGGTVGASGVGYAGTYDPDAASSATQPGYSALILDGLAPGNGAKRRRVIIRRVMSTDNTTIAYQKDGQSVFNVVFSAHYVSEDIKPFHIVDQA